jgi:hypothetical protein
MYVFVFFNTQVLVAQSDRAVLVCLLLLLHGCFSVRLVCNGFQLQAANTHTHTHTNRGLEATQRCLGLCCCQSEFVAADLGQVLQHPQPSCAWHHAKLHAQMHPQSLAAYQDTASQASHLRQSMHHEIVCFCYDVIPIDPM